MKWNRLNFNRWCYEHQLVVILIVALLLLLLVALVASRCQAQPRMKIDSTFATETLSPLSLNSDTLIWTKTYQYDITYWHEITEGYYIEVTPGVELWPGLNLDIDSLPPIDSTDVDSLGYDADYIKLMKAAIKAAMKEAWNEPLFDSADTTEVGWQPWDITKLGQRWYEADREKEQENEESKRTEDHGRN